MRQLSATAETVIEMCCLSAAVMWQFYQIVTTAQYRSTVCSVCFFVLYIIYLRYSFLQHLTSSYQFLYLSLGLPLNNSQIPVAQHYASIFLIPIISSACQVVLLQALIPILWISPLPSFDTSICNKWHLRFSNRRKKTEDGAWGIWKGLKIRLVRLDNFRHHFCSHSTVCDSVKCFF